MSRAAKEYKEMLNALIVSKKVCESLLNQLGIRYYKQADLQVFVRQCAIDLTQKNQAVGKSRVVMTSKKKRDSKKTQA